MVGSDVNTSGTPLCCIASLLQPRTCSRRCRQYDQDYQANGIRLLMLYDSRAKVLQYVIFTCVPNSCLSTHASCHTIDKMDQESFSPPPKVLFCPLQQTLNFYYALIVSGVSIMSVVI